MNTPQADIAVTILGSGTCVPSLSRSSCSVFMEVGTDGLLFDLGPGTMRRLLKSGRSIDDVSHIFLSHFHPDHSGELASFLFSTQYPDPRRRQAPLTLCTGRGGRRFFSGLKTAYDHWIHPPQLRHIIELDNESADERLFGKFRVNSIPMNHCPESVAFRISVPGGTSVVYSGDTDFTENLVELARGADLLICECAVPDSMKVPGHLTPSLAGEMAEQAGVRHLVLTHFYPPCEETDMIKECRQSYTGRITLADDLMTFHLPEAG